VDQLSAALAHHRAGRLAEAERLYRLVCAADPTNARAFHLLGVVAHQLRRQDAADLVGRAIALRPGVAEVHNDHGVILGAQGKLDAAAAAFEQAVRLKPDYIEARNNLGAALQQLGRRAYESGRLDEALAQSRRLVALHPDAAGARNNLANVLRELGKTEDALAQYDHALAIDPGFVAAHYNRALALRRRGDIAAARAGFERASALEPDFFEAELAACMAELPVIYADAGEIDACRAAYADHLERLAAHVARAGTPAALAGMVGSHQPFYLAYQGRDDRDLQASYGALVARIMAARFSPARLPPPPAPHEPVRLGVVSAFFRQHSNWKIPIKGWLAGLDRKRFRVFGYHTGRERDAQTAVAAGLCERFVQGPLRLDDWRQAILADAPHVLLYPEIGMDDVTAQLAAQRLAPLQCASWGHPVTSGFPTIDHFLSSDRMEPADGEAHYTERLVRLPNLSICYEPPATRPAALARAELGLSAGATVFWCCQSLPKYLPQYDEVFARIARATGDCQFTFIEFAGGPQVTAVFRRRLDAAFARSGLRAADHCVILPRLDPDRFIAAMGACDVVLDSIGWSGCNSTLESLVHDLPIVTLRGELMRGRHTSAVLEMMGLDETIARTVDDYVEIAGRLGNSAAERASMSARIAASKHRVFGDRGCIVALEDFLDRAARLGAPVQPVC
jgi:predicted O-linked N-acetylglucosamine transferase (SPINDLY family)